ncbi:MAG: hypothetical protein LC734_11435, partial [Acidobacteria bacterium]|nr:hypothetical protein [Acidobacteriota bacterium]
MHSAKNILRAAAIILPLFGITAFGFEHDDEVPEVTDRVARVSFVKGDVQIRRGGSQDWERAVLNLPVVEADEITVGDGRAEIQFDSRTHLRLSENSFLKLATLKDGGIAVI